MEPSKPYPDNEENYIPPPPCNPDFIEINNESENNINVSVDNPFNPFSETSTNDINANIDSNQESNNKRNKTNWKYVSKSIRNTANYLKETTAEASETVKSYHAYETSKNAVSTMYTAAKDFEQKHELIPKGKKMAVSTYESTKTAASTMLSKVNSRSKS